MISPARPAPFWADKISPQINTLWRGAWAAGTVEPARYLCDHELVLVTQGVCTVEIEDTRVDLQAGDYVIIPPETRHTTTTKRGVYRHCVHFHWQESIKSGSRHVWCYYVRRPRRSAVTLRPRFVPRKTFAGSFTALPSLPPLIETLFHRWQKGEQVSQALARATLIEILVLLLNAPGLKTRAPNRGIEHACAVRDLLDRQSGSDDGIQALLKGSGFSYAHLCRLFHRAFGITPVEYRTALRLERAKALLPDSRRTIAEIAYAVGFKDAGYFTRQFRRQNGVSPNQVRRDSTRAGQRAADSP